MPRPFAPLAALLCAGALLFAGPASAADSVFWTNYEADMLSAAPLSGGSGADIAPTPAAPQGPFGSVVDAATGKLYWANYDSGTIGVSNLDGSGATTLNTAGATVLNPAGLAIDPAAGKIFWANQTADKISWAALDGSGGGDLNTAGATVENPDDVAVYPASGRIYWANYVTNSIGSANLDGSGAGADLSIPGADLDGPDGVAIDAASNTIYWTNNISGSIGYASLSGLGAGLLPIAGMTTQAPTGVAIDPEAARIYWADEGGGGIYAAPLAGGSAQRLDTGAAQAAEPSYPFLFEAPQRTADAVPAVLPIAQLGSTLTCGASNQWKRDLPEAGLFRAPQAITYTWTLGGVPIAGATGPTLTATAAGSYLCTTVATNGAGSTAGFGSAWLVRPGEERTPEEGPHRPLLEISKLKRSPKSGTVTILAQVSGPGTATLTGKSVVRRTARSSGAGVVKVKVAAKGRALRRLTKTGKVKVAIELGYRGSEGAEIFISRAITLTRRIRH